MKVSVIMSVFNGEKNITAAIESILNQTYKDFEFIIVDDGSNDRSYEIIKNYADKDDRIKIIRNSRNIGLTKSLNKAIKQAKGEFIARQDDDDISLPSRLDLQVNFLEKNSNYSFCGCNGIIKKNNEELIKFFDLEDIRKNLILRNCFCHPSILIRKNIFNQFGFYNEHFSLGQDFELWCRLIYKHNLKAKNLKDQLIIADIPQTRSFNKNSKRKFIRQLKNGLISVLKYFKYSRYKMRGIKSILTFSINIILFSIIPIRIFLLLTKD